MDHTLHLLDEATQTLQAIRAGCVDAFVVEEADGHKVYALESADLPYSALVERMQQGAAMLNANSHLIYCNLSLGQLLGLSREKLIGQSLQEFLIREDLPRFEKLLADSRLTPSEGEFTLLRNDGAQISANFSCTQLSRDKSAMGVLITDLTPQKQQAEFASLLQGVQDEERKRIARELHDSVGQLLAAVGMNIGAVRAHSSKLPPEAARAVADNAILIEQASSEIRTISHLLHPPLLDVAGLVSALRWYVDGFSERSKIKVDLHIPDDFGRYSEELELALFRIVQECLTNIHRHSGSSTAAISLYRDDNRIVIQVQDQGKGMSPEKQKTLATPGQGGVGFVGMRERVRQLGGSLEVQSGNSGTTVRATLKVE
jgi:PAS domain S-box-containing protein